MSEALARRSCVPCRGGVPPLTPEQIAPLLAQVDGWSVDDDKQLRKVYRFRNFRQALDFVNRIGEIAEAEGHHPDVHLAWGRVGVATWTHTVGGLTESDFILAAKIDRARAAFDAPARMG